MITTYRGRVHKARANPAEPATWWWAVRDLSIEAPYSDVVHAGVQPSYLDAIDQVRAALGRLAELAGL